MGKVRRGWLALVGGGEDKLRDCDVLRTIVEVNDAQRVVIIPTASRVGDEVGHDYDRAFAAVGVPYRRVINVVRSEEASQREAVAAIEAADLIFFTGGDQVRLVDLLQDTPLIDAVHQRLNEGATIAGTSAGAAAAGHRMLFDGDGRGFNKGSIGTGDGFGFLADISIDTHFVSRGRLARLAQFLCRGDSLKGLGLSEDTGVLISPDQVAEVIGSDMVTALSFQPVANHDYHSIGDNQRFTVDGLRLSFLAPGSRFDLRHWRTVTKAPARGAMRLRDSGSPALA